MFCTKCGGRIPPEASKCPNCGADLPVMEYCSGFWSELNQNTKSGAKEEMTAEGQEEVWERADGTAAEEPRTEPEDAFAQAPPVSGESGTSEAEDRKSAGKPARRAKKRSVLRYMPAVLAAVLLLLLAGSLFHISGLRRQLQDTEEQLQVRQGENEVLREDYQHLLAEYSFLYVQDIARKEGKNIWDAAMETARHGIMAVFQENEEEISGAENAETAEPAGEENTETAEPDGEENGNPADFSDTEDTGLTESAGQDTGEQSGSSVQKRNTQEASPNSEDGEQEEMPPGAAEQT